MLFVRLVVKHCTVLYYSTVYVNPSLCAIYNSSIFSIIFCTVLPNYCSRKKITVIGNICVPSTCQWYLRTLIGQPRGVSIESVTVCVYIVATVRKSLDVSTGAGRLFLVFRPGRYVVTIVYIIGTSGVSLATNAGSEQVVKKRVITVRRTFLTCNTNDKGTKAKEWDMMMRRDRRVDTWLHPVNFCFCQTCHF